MFSYDKATDTHFYTEGQFNVTISPDDIMGVGWTVRLGDEVIEVGSNYTIADAVEDSMAELQEYVDVVSEALLATLTA